MIVSGSGWGKVVGNGLEMLVDPVANVVQLKSAAWHVKHADRMMGAEAAGVG